MTPFVKKLIDSDSILLTCNIVLIKDWRPYIKPWITPMSYMCNIVLIKDWRFSSKKLFSNCSEYSVISFLLRIDANVASRSLFNAYLCNIVLIKDWRYIYAKISPQPIPRSVISFLLRIAAFIHAKNPPFLFLFKVVLEMLLLLVKQAEVRKGAYLLFLLRFWLRFGGN